MLLRVVVVFTRAEIQPFIPRPPPRPRPRPNERNETGMEWVRYGNLHPSVEFRSLVVGSCKVFPPGVRNPRSPLQAFVRVMRLRPGQRAPDVYEIASVRMRRFAHSHTLTHTHTHTHKYTQCSITGHPVGGPGSSAVQCVNAHNSNAISDGGCICVYYDGFSIYHRIFESSSSFTAAYTLPSVSVVRN